MPAQATPATLTTTHTARKHSSLSTPLGSRPSTHTHPLPAQPLFSPLPLYHKQLLRHQASRYSADMSFFLMACSIEIDSASPPPSTCLPHLLLPVCRTICIPFRL